MKIGRKEVALDRPAYFIADIAANHDGSYERAERLIYLAAEAGADAVKFQNFKAETIVCDYGFKELGAKSHQIDWKESVYDTYKRYETPLDWTPRLKRVADNAGVDYLTTPYDLDILPYLSEYTCAWKIGSGDITYEPLINLISEYDKPILLATGASSTQDVTRAINWLTGKDLVLMQCNSNYEAIKNNFPYVNLKVLCDWWKYTGRLLLGFSDHTPGHSAVLGAIALAAKVIEKHFTDDNLREGPDHAFSMTPVTWRAMVDRTRELEAALGDGIKRIEDNERETVILQRRAIRAAYHISAGDVLNPEDLICLRPCPSDALPPYRLEELIGVECKRDVAQGDYFRDSDVLA